MCPRVVGWQVKKNPTNGTRGENAKLSLANGQPSNFFTAPAPRRGYISASKVEQRGK